MTQHSRQKLYQTLLQLSIAVSVLSCGGDSAVKGDTTPPTVLTTTPANGAANVPVDGAIAVTFSEVMRAATLTSATFTVEGAVGAVSYSNGSAAFTPTADLLPNTTYTAAVDGSVTDTSGNALTTRYTWQFTTGTAGKRWGTAALLETDDGVGAVASVPQIVVDNSGNGLAVWQQSDGTRTPQRYGQPLYG
ncbi:MAG: hypothetical protein FD130_2375 [Halothiobacillaceae bacterium]|nr:MAG: hypothetical protein FD130_2375 [Halothiobacillaceae bacterium]